MKAKYLHEQLIEYFNVKLSEYKKEIFERQRQTDNVVIWIAGLSTGAIALILSQSSNTPIIDLIILKISSALLLLTIISAVLFRAYLYILEQMEADLILGFEGYCYGLTCEIYGPIKIEKYHTIKDIAEILKEDMGLDYDNWLTIEYLTREFWVDHYNKWAEFWRKTEDEGLRNLGRAFAPILGKKQEETEDLFLKKQNNNQLLNKTILYRKICSWSYNLVLIFFLSAIFIIVIGFFIK
jgi:hypothetical protein